MKRSVNVLMIVIHNLKVIFFNEPINGLVPQSYGFIGDFIRDFEKKIHNVIITTYCMEEVDDLSEDLTTI